MNATHTPSSSSSLTTARVLAALLERLDNSRVPVDATQYRSVVLHLEGELKQLPSDKGLGVLLDTHPSAAQVYENVNYAHAGLVRSALEPSLDAERLAKDAIQRAMRSPKEGIPDGQS